MKLKVCGMRDADNIREVAKLSPDFMGFIFYPKSKRYVGEDFVMPEIPAGIKKVGVFVNESVENILAKASKYKLDLVQLHGDESPALTTKVWETFVLGPTRAKVIKAFGIDEQFDFLVLNEYETCCDFFLFDTKTKEYGGSGKKFDAGLLKKYNLDKPFFISGGLDLAVTPHLLSHVPRPFALDINSKFETEPGLKDISKLKSLKNELSGKR